jgi:hypothetical protein
MGVRRSAGPAGVAPLGAVRFLDIVCELLFLQRDGEIYPFRHVVLRNYFAVVAPEEIVALA